MKKEEGKKVSLEGTMRVVARARLPLECDEDAEVMSFGRGADDPEGVMVVKLGVRHFSKRGFSPYVRLHSSCKTGDIMGSLRCDCREQLMRAQGVIASKGGYIIYLDEEGRGIGFSNKIRAYSLQDEGLDTYAANEMLHLPSDARNYDDAVEVLQVLGVKEFRLLTNNPSKLERLRDAGLEVEREALITSPNRFNEPYLESKKKIGGHLS